MVTLFLIAGIGVSVILTMAILRSRAIDARINWPAMFGLLLVYVAFVFAPFLAVKIINAGLVIFFAWRLDFYISESP